MVAYATGSDLSCVLRAASLREEPAAGQPPAEAPRAMGLALAIV